MTNKKLGALVGCLAVLACLFFIWTALQPAQAASIYKLWLCHSGATGGGANDLDGIHSSASGLPTDQDAIALVWDYASGTSVLRVFLWQSGTSKTETTTYGAHPWYIMPDDRPTNGMWAEISGITGWVD